MVVPSLETLCVSAATEGRHWLVQRRSLERLPEHAANELLALLLVRQPGEIRPATLELFRHCVTRLELTPPPAGTAAAVAGSLAGGGGGGGSSVGPAVTATASFGPDWAAALAGFSHLAELRLPGCSRLNFAALQALLLPAPAMTKAHAFTSTATAAANAAAAAAATPAASAAPAVAAAVSVDGGGVCPKPPLCRSPAAAALRRLDVSGCSRLGNDAAALIARSCGGSGGGSGTGGNSGRINGASDWGLSGNLSTNGLVSLDISETAITGAGLRHLSTLAGLTELRAAGLKSCTDADWCALLPHLPALRRLDAWGTDAGDGGDGGEQLLAVLATCTPGTSGTAGTCGRSSMSAAREARGGGGGGDGSGSGKDNSNRMGMHRLEQLSLAWTCVRVAPAFPALQVLDLRHCQLEDVWWPDSGGGAGSGGAALPLRQLLLRGAVIAGGAAATDSGIAEIIRRAAATLELLDIADVAAPAAGQALAAAGPGAGGAWPLPLAALAGTPVHGGGDGGGSGGGGKIGGGGAPRLAHLDISRTAVPAEQLEQLQHAPALRKLIASGCRGAGSTRGAAALVAAGLGQLRELDLSAAGVTDECVSWLQQLSALTSLNLSGNAALTLEPPSPPQRLPPQRAAQGQGGQQQQQQPGLEEDEAAEEEVADPMEDVWRREGGGRLLQEEATRAAERGGSAGSSSRSSDDGGDGCSSSVAGMVWPQLLRLNLLGTRVSEEGLRALLSALAGRAHRGARRSGGSSGGCGPGDASSPMVRAPALEQLKLGGAGFTDGAAAALAAARLPRLHSLLVRGSSLSGHGALQLAASSGDGGGGGDGGLTALRRLELQACWLVSPQDAARMASCMAAAAAATAAGTGSAAGPVLVVVNGKAAGVAAAAPPAGYASGARSGAAASASAPASAVVTTASAARRAAVAARGGVTAGVARTPAAAVADDLAPYDQRLRYSREELVALLVAAPMAGGGAAAGCIWPQELGEAPPHAAARWGLRAAEVAAGTAGAFGGAEGPQEAGAGDDGCGDTGSKHWSEASVVGSVASPAASADARATAATARASVLAQLPPDLVRPAMSG
ncbi:hypothetical protein HYH02_001549 [Chlamydomonas schloesseri]|uniref:Uncharacterized protein n=1 Tax=Chlamydomonas schloesseri TaxID=2026947 RepID=A0A835WTA1_9CHLO|nr:hypothetical protein HYH02_001549 [Chlamydomonas schloesseri]|eukprot:KAG2453325.1 hypothetical protein HYH02_001549 [Chlamydomonas schloesseri]